MAHRKDLPDISTGHATTTAAVVLTIKRILEEAGRVTAGERVGFLGLGSVGMASPRLMLRCLPHPAEIILCDVYSKIDSLEAIRKELVGDLGFQGGVCLAEARTEIPGELYDATLIIGATNVADILDVARVQPGTVIVDDSAPHCFVTARAARRFREQEDILFTEGGVLRSPHPISTLIDLPRPAQRFMTTAHAEVLSKYSPFHITGCILSSLLSSRFEELAPTVGLVDDETCVQHYDVLDRLGFQAAALHCEGYVLAEQSIRNFRRRFSGSGTLAR